MVKLVQNSIRITELSIANSQCYSIVLMCYNSFIAVVNFLNLKIMNRSELIHNRLMECIHKGEVEKKEIIAILKDVSFYAGLQNLTIYAKELNISVQAARKHNDIIEISGKKFHINYD